jgi:hypothetical protein
MALAFTQTNGLSQVESDVCPSLAATSTVLDDCGTTYVVMTPSSSSDGELGPFVLELREARVAVTTDLFHCGRWR